MSTPILASSDEDVNRPPVLTERLMKAVRTIRHWGEPIEVIYTGQEGRIVCLLDGPGSEPGTVDLYIWCRGNRVKPDHPIRLEDVQLDPFTLRRLEYIAKQQEAKEQQSRSRANQNEAPSAAKVLTPEEERAREFIVMQMLKRGSGRRRNAAGHYLDGTHTCEPAGRR